MKLPHHYYSEAAKLRRIADILTDKLKRAIYLGDRKAEICIRANLKDYLNELQSLNETWLSPPKVGEDEYY